ncbi:hypothetical protein HPB50_016374 [Hyalomma asiaticum]|uniref:Uncharacterized protein n=1 Tax=Hyalomma asiaticum TaxID=266040 RepID=A0ACB7RTM0_HYAAI|nr:hypothetical protein HPB50_016374 [Hyalomma asiaticum]
MFLNELTIRYWSRAVTPKLYFMVHYARFVRECLAWLADPVTDSSPFLRPESNIVNHRSSTEFRHVRNSSPGGVDGPIYLARDSSGLFVASSAGVLRAIIYDDDILVPSIVDQPGSVTSSARHKRTSSTPAFFSGRVHSSAGRMLNRFLLFTQLRTNALFVKKTSKSVDAVNSHLVSGAVKLEGRLKFANATFTCKHGGTQRTRGTGVRPNQRTMKMECPARVVIAARHASQELEVTCVVLEHNHETTCDMLASYPECRKLNDHEVVRRAAQPHRTETQERHR